MRLTKELNQRGDGGMEPELPRPVGFLLAVLVPAALGLLGVAWAVSCLNSYGWAVFMVLPLVVSALSAFFARRFLTKSYAACYGLSVLSILVLAGFILALAIDGTVCLVMASPLALLIAVPGSMIGRALGGLSDRSRRVAPWLLLLIFPAFQGFEYAHPVESTIRQVTSRVTIDAPIEMIWEQVIAFDRITKPPEGIFRTGIAYPIQARIFGRGVGAIRYCIFSTGPFIEPITTWKPPNLLEFDVTENPPPMTELSPYKHLDAPHLHGTFVSKHGRFRLWEENGKVVLEGTTWYYQRILPDWYWHVISDAIIHKIHLRVLEQIQHQSEVEAHDAKESEGA
ncbi:hypothetical protein BH09VER1_BH09VER1_15290 [soil metagenome]